MQKFVLSAIFMLAASFSFSQKQADWKEMQDFHAVMSKTFHPSEENNLQPLKENAENLLKAARAWRAAEIPAGYNTTLTTATLKKLVKQCSAIQVAVKKKKDDMQLKKMITEAHEIFHEIMEKCRPGADDKHE